MEPIVITGLLSENKLTGVQDAVITVVAPGVRENDIHMSITTVVPRNIAMALKLMDKVSVSLSFPTLENPTSAIPAPVLAVDAKYPSPPGTED